MSEGHRWWRTVVFVASVMVATRAGAEHVDSCIPGASTFATSVTFSGPPGLTIAGLGIAVEYPRDEVAAPAFTAASGVANVTNDEGGRFIAEPIKIGGLPRPFMHAMYKRCEGTTAPATSDFTCTVTDASDNNGNVIDSKSVSCAVTLP